MDSITQGLLGATTFALIKDKEIGKKSLLIGAIAGTIPDLDVLLTPLFNDVESLTIHRSVSHSIGLAILLSLLLGEIFHRIFKKEQSRLSWMFAFFLSMMTHSLLDWCTTYGTKLLSPFNDHLFSTNNIHVFEPIYTVVLLIGAASLFFRPQSCSKRQKIVRWTLIISTTYLLWTFVSKGIANQHFVTELERQEIGYEKLMVSPTPFNSVLWHGIAKVENGYYMATYSLFDTRDEIEFQFEHSANDLIPKIKENRLVNYYLEYTQDFPLIKKDPEGNISIYAIKYGPVNYVGKPEFINPLCFNKNELEDEKIRIDKSGKQKGPVKNYKNLFRRIRGI